MTLTLFRVDAGHGHERILLRSGQRVTVGRAHEADLWCMGDETLGEVHFAVELRANEAWVTLLAPRAGPLRLNGQAVLEAALRDGDTIQAGQSQFRVTIDQPPPPAAPALSLLAPAASPIEPALSPIEPALAPFEPAASPLASSLSPLAAALSPLAPAASLEQAMAPLPVRRLNLESGAVRLTIAEGQPHVEQILLAIGRGKQLYVLVNFRAARQPLPVSIEPDDDLYRGAPDEVRQDNSLHLILCTDAAEAARRVSPLAAKDAAMILVTGQSREQLLASHQLLWAWLRSPSSLNTQLTHGSPDLAEKLLAGIDAILAPQPKDAALAVFAAASGAAEMHSALLAIQVPVEY